MKKTGKKRMGRPRKPADKQKSRYLQVRVTDPEKSAFDRASDIAGMDLSVWVRDRLRIVARGEITKAGEKPAFDLEN